MRPKKIKDLTVSFNERENTATITTHWANGRVYRKYRIIECNKKGSHYYPYSATYRDWTTLLHHGTIAI